MEHFFSNYFSEKYRNLSLYNSGRSSQLYEIIQDDSDVSVNYINTDKSLGKKTARSEPEENKEVCEARIKPSNKQKEFFGLKIEPSKKDIENPKFLQNKKKADFKEYKNDILKSILSYRGESTSGSKDDLVSRLIELQKKLKKEDEKLKKMVDSEELENLTNEQLDKFLVPRALKYGTTKHEKINLLTTYIIDIVSNL
jgi:hypothetical protein